VFAGKFSILDILLRIQSSTAASVPACSILFADKADSWLWLIGNYLLQNRNRFY
jgi:hypothetical protein